REGAGAEIIEEGVRRAVGEVRLADHLAAVVDIVREAGTSPQRQVDERLAGAVVEEPVLVPVGGVRETDDLPVLVDLLGAAEGTSQRDRRHGIGMGEGGTDAQPENSRERQECREGGVAPASLDKMAGPVAHSDLLFFWDAALGTV